MWDPARCVIPTIWCGAADAMPAGRGYTRVGTRQECLKKGYGAGKFGEERRHFPATSLRQIAYIGEVYAQQFANAGVNTLAQLTAAVNALPTANAVQLYLVPKLTRAGNGGLDRKAFNSMVLWLHEHGVPPHKLPGCRNIPPP